MSAHLESACGSRFEVDPALAQLLAQRRAARRVTPEDVAARVIAILEAAMRLPPPRALQLEEVAERMHVSSRTLKRHLQAAGLSFRPLLDRVRLSRAVEMLRGTSLPVEEIAVCVGYSSAANLSRALWRWSGEKPGDLRRSGLRETNPSGLRFVPGISSRDKVAAGEDLDAAQSFED